MEEKDITNIANAVTNALAKLNADAAGEKGEERKEKGEEETFVCPDCGAKITAGIGFCQACGCALEWGE
jgi:hypothetical protein